MPEPAPTLSVVVVVYNIPREVPRTLLSLSASYQRDIAADDYEIIVVDNGSTPPLDAAIFNGLIGNFRLIRMDPASPSPAAAVNRGLSEAKGDVIGVMIDGARIVTPGLLHFARHAAALYPRAVVATLGWYLGSDIQKLAAESGYNAEREDALLASIGWPADGYRLFEIATPDEASVDGWLLTIFESNALFLRREMWTELGGLDERFDSPGGGLVNPDTFTRAMELSGSRLVLLLGEGTFHQFHGGIATNSKLEVFVESVERWHRQYAELRGHRFKAAPPSGPRTYIGTLPRAALFRLVSSAVYPVRATSYLPLGEAFDRKRWSIEEITEPQDPVTAALVNLARAEFAAEHYDSAAGVARLARQRDPDEPEPQRLLAQLGPALLQRSPAKPRADFHVVMGDAHALLGNIERAAAEFRAALAIDDTSARSYIGLSKLWMPGDGYLTWLARIHQLLVPATYLEIGVNQGLSLAQARPPTRAIGVDPAADIRVRFQTETHLFAETSDDFFAQKRLAPLLRGETLRLAFIDGLHLYEQALLDFINVEAHCGPDSVILLHDTMPLDNAAQERERRMNFHTGDVWKVVSCLKHYRPSLDIFTIATPWSGLTAVTNVDPHCRVLADNYADAVERFVDLPFSAVEKDLHTALNIVPNDWDLMAPRFQPQNARATTS